MAFPVATLARDEIVAGRAYQRTIALEASASIPDGNTTLASILSDGATATVSIVDTDPDATEILALTATVTAASRTLALTVTAAATTGLTPGVYRWQATATTSEGVFPIEIGDTPIVRALPGTGAPSRGSSATVHPERITVGCDALVIVTITPPSGMTSAEVVTALTGATATAAIVDMDGSTSIVANGSIGKSITASTRKLEMTIADTITALLTPGVYRWSVYVTTSGGTAWPVAMGDAQVFAA
jgi:hypothetical protein